jgi:putative ABC transport system substrate-binding protein
MKICDRLAHLFWSALCSLAVVGVSSMVGAEAVRAQTSERVYRIGFLGQTSAADVSRQLVALRQGLRDLGYEEGRNLRIEYRWADRKLDTLPALATELVGLKVDAIVTHGTAGSRAATQATSTIPIVIAVIGDPVGNGVVASLARPGGNATGLVLEEFETTVKWLELLKQVAPRASRIGWFEVPGIERPQVAERTRLEEDGVAKSLGLDVHRVTVSGPSDLPGAFDELRNSGVQAVVVPNTSLLNPLWAQISSLALEHRLVTIGSSQFARSGALLGYAPDGADMYRRAATFLDRILKGANPAELAMEGPPKFDLILNLRTARALGIVMPAQLLARADQTIE